MPILKSALRYDLSKASAQCGDPPTVDHARSVNKQSTTTMKSKPNDGSPSCNPPSFDRAKHSSRFESLKTSSACMALSQHDVPVTINSPSIESHVPAQSRSSRYGARPDSPAKRVEGIAHDSNDPEFEFSRFPPALLDYSHQDTFLALSQDGPFTVLDEDRPFARLDSPEPDQDSGYGGSVSAVVSLQAVLDEANNFSEMVDHFFKVPDHFCKVPDPFIEGADFSMLSFLGSAVEDTAKHSTECDDSISQSYAGNLLEDLPLSHVSMDDLPKAFQVVAPVTHTTTSIHTQDVGTHGVDSVHKSLVLMDHEPISDTIQDSRASGLRRHQEEELKHDRASHENVCRNEASIMGWVDATKMESENSIREQSATPISHISTSESTSCSPDSVSDTINGRSDTGMPNVHAVELLQVLLEADMLDVNGLVSLEASLRGDCSASPATDGCETNDSPQSSSTLANTCRAASEKRSLSISQTDNGDREDEDNPSKRSNGSFGPISSDTSGSTNSIQMPCPLLEAGNCQGTNTTISELLRS